MMGARYPPSSTSRRRSRFIQAAFVIHISIASAASGRCFSAAGHRLAGYLCQGMLGNVLSPAKSMNQPSTGRIRHIAGTQGVVKWAWPSEVKTVLKEQKLCLRKAPETPGADRD